MGYLYTDIPQYLSYSLAAALAGLSRKTFKARFIKTGRVKPSCEHLWRTPGTGRAFIYLWQLQKALGRTFTLEDVQEADHKLEKARERARRYRREHA